MRRPQNLTIIKALTLEASKNQHWKPLLIRLISNWSGCIVYRRLSTRKRPGICSHNPKDVGNIKSAFLKNTQKIPGHRVL